ncbi:bifunctional DNA primase/polymerase [Streptomyces sp. CG1]|uniref:bifunctional DNA primase/polymerase n=1 Tax=Streptomyces sp. CG1 TaxID=1287523 RepID=UPI0034E1C96E
MLPSPQQGPKGYLYLAADRKCRPLNKEPYANCPQCDRKSAACITHTPDECGCGVDTCHGFHAATTDVRVIEGWWAEEPNANIGAPCKLNGWAAIDVDPRHGGDISYALVESDRGLLPGTTLQVTGGGGFQALYRAPDFPLPGELAVGIELKLNGYVLLAPSVHSSGAQYRWVNDLFNPPVVPWPKQASPRGTRRSQLCPLAPGRAGGLRPVLADRLGLCAGPREGPGSSYGA